MSGDSPRTVRAGRHTVEVHRQDKVLFPGDGGAKEYTKGDLVDYYRSVAPFMLPHLRGRPLMLERHPDGVDGPRFMQKNTPEHYPEWISRVELAKEGGTVCHTVCDDSATLVYLADQAALTLHRWLSRVGRVERPDRMVFDLDPADDPGGGSGGSGDAAGGSGRDSGDGSGGAFESVREAARLLGELLDELKLPSALMTTGSRGLHVIVPVDGHHDFDEVRAFARDVADTLVAGHPDRLTTAARKKERGDRLYLDVQRNAYAQTVVAPYTVRARPGAPVATPIAWSQLDEPGLDARRWTVADAADQARTDPWAGVMTRGRSLGPARRRLNALRG